MNSSLELLITEADIINGHCLSAHSCPIALAAMRHFPGYAVGVVGAAMFVTKYTDDGNGKIASHVFASSKEVINFIEKFDGLVGGADRSAFKPFIAKFTERT